MTTRFFAVVAVLISLQCSVIAQGDIENVIVETYYISDASDATDADGGALEAGSKTFRVFLDLSAGAKLVSIYGDTNHVLLISSTTPFFNNEDRGEVFGFDIGTNFLDDNTTALDSWLSFGAASETHFGILKSEDPDTSMVGGVNNDGGSDSVEGGLLINNDALAGIPLIERDGLIAWTDSALADLVVVGDNPESVFNDETVSNIYSSDGVTMLVPDGVQGPTADNRILIAQLTTTGELTFDFNVEIMNVNGDIIKYVANDSILLEGENVSAFLKYPPTCGCIDPLFLEYDPAAGCDDGSCQTLVVLGCADTLACNFDPEVNFNVQELCCVLPDNCIGLDPDLICPEYVGLDEMDEVAEFSLYPNPADGYLVLAYSQFSDESITYSIHNSFGKLILENKFPAFNQDGLTTINTTELSTGVYFIQLMVKGKIICRNFIKS